MPSRWGATGTASAQGLIDMRRQRSTVKPAVSMALRVSRAEWQPPARQLLVPWLVLAAPLGAMCLRLTLNTTLDAMDEDYVRTGTAKGLAPRRVVLRHAAPAFFVTTASFVGISIPLLVTNLVLVERTLAVPGFLRHTWKALGTMDAGHERLTDHGPRPDFPMLCALTVWGCVLIVVLGLISDAVLPWLDPRIRRSD
jgi:peptide/nickel transport system permease protein